MPDLRAIIEEAQKADNALARAMEDLEALRHRLRETLRRLHLAADSEEEDADA